MRQHQTNAKNEAKVTHTVDQEGFHVGKDRRRTRIPETDQQVRNETNRFPAEEELHEVVAHHQHQHREGEQRDVAEEAVVAGIVVHVANGVDMHHQRNESHHQHHGDRQRIDQETDLKAVITGGQPLIDRTVKSVAGHHVTEDHHRSNKGDGHASDGRRMCHPARQHAAQKAGDHGAKQGRQRNQQIEFLHFHDQPFRLSRSSTWMVFRLRNSTTRMARPIADSAAATVSTKKTKT